MRQPIVAGNWKMNKATGDGAELATAVREQTVGAPAEVVLCPPFTALHAVGDVLRGSDVKLGAQDVFWEPDGAYTGAISVSMLRDLGCAHVIVGHSERRTYFNETDEGVRRKARAALDGSVRPIICVGETLEQRDAGVTERVIREQVENGLRGFGDALLETVIAYEPVWAIGTGRTASPPEAQAAHAFIRGVIGEMAGAEVAAAIRILYGGSVKPDNAAKLFRQPDIDGGLIGGAALEVSSFMEIVRAAG